MPRFALTQSEAHEVLASQNLVRVAFRDGASLYLIPVGFAWIPSALYGMTDAGRKTRLAEKNPEVSFQVDTSNDTGLWEWRSVTGEGRFEIVDDDLQKLKVLEALDPLVETSPDWWRREQGPRMVAGELLVWKITPTNLEGRRYGRPVDSQTDE